MRAKSTNRAQACGLKNPKACARKIKTATAAFLVRIKDPAEQLMDADGGFEEAMEDLRAAVERFQRRTEEAVDYLSEEME